MLDQIYFGSDTFGSDLIGSNIFRIISDRIISGIMNFGSFRIGLFGLVRIRIFYGLYMLRLGFGSVRISDHVRIDGPSFFGSNFGFGFGYFRIGFRIRISFAGSSQKGHNIDRWNSSATAQNDLALKLKLQDNSIY